MRPEEIKKLLGGYAAGNLTPAEQQALFAAALEDQDLFDALAREQALRDVLRDPAARAELLAALDSPPSGLAAFLQWLLRPMVAKSVTAGVAVVALVAVWQATRHPAHTGYITVAELRQEELRPGGPMPEIPKSPSASPNGAPAPAVQADKLTPAPAEKAKRALGNETAPALAKQRSFGLADQAIPARVASDGKVVAPAPIQALAPPPPPPPASPPPTRQAVALSAEARLEKEKDANGAADLTARKKEAISEPSQAGAAGGFVEAMPLDARAIFYLNLPVPAANAFAQPANGPSGGGGAALPSRKAGQQNRADSGPALGAVATPQLGVRASILRIDPRGEQEVDLTTVLNAGESVRLKLIPNADGYLRVTEAGRTVATATVQRFKPFETPALPLDGTSPKQLTITFSRTPQADAVSLDAAGRGNLVEPRADQGRATYVISGTSQVVVPVTLTFK